MQQNDPVRWFINLNNILMLQPVAASLDWLDLNNYIL